MSETKKKKFEVKQHIELMSGRIRKDIFIDDELFEYEVDPEALSRAKKMGPQYMEAVKTELQKHFLMSLSDFLGREVTELDVLEATRTGLI
jgi:hypothetical protein